MSGGPDRILGVERPAEGVALLRMQRPEARNALSTRLKDALVAALDDTEADGSVRAVVLTGSGPAFCAGGDIRELGPADTEEMLARGEHPFWRRLPVLRKPLVAAVNGYALGGGLEIVLTADLAVAGHGSVFALPEVGLGILPGAGGTQYLVRAAGKAKALRYLLTGERFTASQAEAMGVLSQVVPDGEVVERAVALAATIARQPRLSVLQIKDVVLRGMDADLATGRALERHANAALFGSGEQRRRMGDFTAGNRTTGAPNGE